MWMYGIRYSEKQAKMRPRSFVCLCVVHYSQRTSQPELFYVYVRSGALKGNRKQEKQQPTETLALYYVVYVRCVDALRNRCIFRSRLHFQPQVRMNGM